MIKKFSLDRSLCFVFWYVFCDTLLTKLYLENQIILREIIWSSAVIFGLKHLVKAAIGYMCSSLA